jgi:hypothetical protein
LGALAGFPSDGAALYGVAPFGAVADTDYIVKGNDKYLPIANLSLTPVPAAGAGFNRFDGGLDKGFINGNFKPNFADQIDVHGLAAKIFGVPLLTAISLHIAYRQTKYLNGREGLLDRFKPKRLNNRHN